MPQRCYIGCSLKRIHQIQTQLFRIKRDWTCSNMLGIGKKIIDQYSLFIGELSNFDEWPRISIIPIISKLLNKQNKLIIFTKLRYQRCNLVIKWARGQTGNGLNWLNLTLQIVINTFLLWFYSHRSLSICISLPYSPFCSKFH